MNTVSQNSTAISLALAVDLDSAENASTKKVFVKRFDNLGMFEQGRWAEMISWCQKNLYHGGHYEPNWSVAYPTFYFYDEREYLLFCLRWS